MATSALYIRDYQMIIFVHQPKYFELSFQLLYRWVSHKAAEVTKMVLPHSVGLSGCGSFDSWFRPDFLEVHAQLNWHR